MSQNRNPQDCSDETLAGCEPGRSRWRRLLAALLCQIVVLGFAHPPNAVADEPIDFKRDIRPILSDKCFACHGPDAEHREAELRLDERESAIESSIVPEKSGESELIVRITSLDVDLVMPPPETRKKLNAKEIQLLRDWIDSGAEYEPHWAFVSVPQQVTVPATDDPQHWIRNGVDAFVLRRLQADKLKPAAEATRERWLRRVTFDLTGLPPTLDEIDAFVADNSDTAFEKVVDRLLDTPASAERFAADWLDAARYADTFGYQADRDMHVWPWRDWVIRSFQQNQSYRDFLVWQIAGDMLPDATTDQRLATTFNRLHRQTNEGGSIEAEFRVEYVADRVRTMGNAMLGLSFECSRCHDHKYDPITMRDYYGLQSIFNNIDEHGLYSHFTETAPTPTLLLYEGDQQQRHLDLLTEIRQKSDKLASLSKSLIAPRSKRNAAAETSEPVMLPKAALTENFDQAAASGDQQLVPGSSGAENDKAIRFGGDDAFVPKDAPELSRTSPFTLSIKVRPEEHSPRVVVVHQSRAAEDSAFRGFSLLLDKGHPTASLIHFWPGNAIRVRATQPVPLNEWSTLTVSYDGSSQASGLRLFVNGRQVETKTIRDRLSRDIAHRKEWGDYDVGNARLALGARFRDVGFRHGAVDDLQVFTEWLSTVQIAMLAGVTPPEDEAASNEHWLLTQSEEYRSTVAELRKLREAENELVGQVRQIMAMEEMPGRRPTFVLARGAYDAPTDAVSPGGPESIFAWPDEYPRNRLGFARWLVDERNPLTARVAVNRFWRLFFGRGLVATTEDFGSQGDVPTHPELLDWLARRFMDSGWDVRELSRTIALSATYRQSSTPADEQTWLADPQNVLLARGPRHRLSAEQLRDNALAVSGLLVRNVGGPSVYPYQPAGLWSESGTGKRYSPSKGEGLYRRSLYSFWRRTSPPPSMTTFDAPSREFCLTRRERTATPMQALTLLNDPQFVEAARVLAASLMSRHPDNKTAQVSDAFRLLTSRQPAEREVNVLTELLTLQREHFAGQADKAREYVTTGESPQPEGLNTADHAALTTVVQALMNYDECVTKR